MKTRLRRLVPERDFVAKALKTTDEVPRGPSLLDAVQVGGAQISVRHIRGQHVVRGDEDLMSDGHRRPLGTPSGSESVELVPEVAALLSGRCHRRLNQSGPQVHVALPGAGLLPFPRALIVAGTDSGPRGRMLGAPEDPHVGPQLGHDDGGHDPADPGDLLQELALLPVGAKGFIDAGVQNGEIAVGLVQPPKLQAQQEAMVLLGAALQRLLQVADSLAQNPSRQGRHLRRRGQPPR